MPGKPSLFSPATEQWLDSTFAAPTDVQQQGWPLIAAGQHALLCAPTGSGKTLAAFLWTIDRLASEATPVPAERCRVLYISPLKALTVDVDRNLRAPLRGISLAAQGLGQAVPAITVGIRSGDTPADERRKMQRTPPDLLITTPESLYLLLTSAARSILGTVRWVIVDEIHSLVAAKRGAHLAVSLERLAHLCMQAKGCDPQRIGLSATQRPLEVAARFLGGGDREVAIVDCGRTKPMQLRVEVPVEEMAAPLTAAGEPSEPPRKGMWPAIEPRILTLIRNHKSTIVFVNSRRVAERMAGALNELAGRELVRTHHGSISKEQRLAAEEELKAGRLPALVATSSLELGIDMGAVDLVIQVGSPTSVTSGLQRIGRAGHGVGEASHGVIFPTYRGDLVESAAIVAGMLAGDVEATAPLRNPLDILAQQIVATVAMDEWSVTDLRAMLMRAQPFTALGDRAFEATLNMLAGRYPSEEFAELRPRLVWDREAGTVRARAGAQGLAVTSGGTIPDRGLYTVNILDDGRRVGELDEEMVYELRDGQTFILGATTWRVAEITSSQVLVVPAPGEPGTVAFWHGDAVGREVAAGLAMGKLMRELAADPTHASSRLRDAHHCDEKARRNLLRYLGDEQEATGALPDDRTVVVEVFRDQLGDWRICVLSCWGARVHTPWALAIAGRLRSRLGLVVEEIHSDDGFALRLPDAEGPPAVDELLLDPEEVVDAVRAQLHGSALFASRFRENAARALLLPRRRPGQRTPLWQQRRRSADLLTVAAQYPDFPIIAETFRECLSDVFDMEALAELMRRIQRREVHVVTVTTEKASPFAQSLVFDYIAQYMYEGDAPLAERRAQALSLDSDLLAELLGSEQLADLIDVDAVLQVELELQLLEAERHPRNVDRSEDVFLRLGDLTVAEAMARGVRSEWLDELEETRRIVPVRIAAEDRLISIEDGARYRDLLGIALPSGLPEANFGPPGDDLSGLLLRWSRTHTSFGAEAVATRWGIPRRLVEVELERMVNRGTLVAGYFSASRQHRDYCHPDVLRALRRRSLARLRKEIEPVPQSALANFLPLWHGIVAPAAHSMDVITQLEGAALPASVFERDVLAARIPNYAPHLLDSLIASGEVLWVGRGSLGKHDGRIAIYRRDGAALLLPPPGEAPLGPVHDAIRAYLSSQGAAFYGDLRAAAMTAGARDAEATLEAIWDLVWAGEVTNDSFVPVRALGPVATRKSAPGPRRGRSGFSVNPRHAGRWSLVANLRAVDSPSGFGERRARAVVDSLLARHGILTREAVLGEGVAGGFAGIYPLLRRMEESGGVRRGYFIEGLGGSQFALPGAVDRLRTVRAGGAGIVALAATDPANPYGATLAWPDNAGRMARAAGAYVVIDDGEVRLFLQRGGRSLITAPGVEVGHVESLVNRLGVGKIEIREIDGSPARTSPLAPLLQEAGFGMAPRGLVRWPLLRGAFRA